LWRCYETGQGVILCDEFRDDSREKGACYQMALKLTLVNVFQNIR